MTRTFLLILLIELSGCVTKKEMFRYGEICRNTGRIEGISEGSKKWEESYRNLENKIREIEKENLHFKHLFNDGIIRLGKYKKCYCSFDGFIDENEKLLEHRCDKKPNEKYSKHGFYFCEKHKWLAK